MVVDFTKKLDPEQTIKTHKEEKENCHVVDLLAGSLENLVDSSLWHRKLEKNPDKPKSIRDLKLNFNCIITYNWFYDISFSASYP